jgi:DNA-binding transcriptional LysR family regulator
VVSLPKVLASFQQQHPDVTLELMSEFGPADLNRREADIALRITKNPPDSSLGRRICDFTFCAYASPSYLERAGTRALADLDWVIFQPTVGWTTPLIFPSREAQEARTVFQANSVHTVVAAAREGIGALVISSFLADTDPGLVRIAGPFSEVTMQLWVLMHPDLRKTARVTALMHHIARELRHDEALFEGV